MPEELWETKYTNIPYMTPPAVHMRDYYDFLDGKKLWKCPKCGLWYRHCAKCGSIIGKNVQTYLTYHEYCTDHYCECILEDWK